MSKPNREIVTSLTALHRRVQEAIAAALEGYTDEKYVKWAQGWLDGTDRSANSAAFAAALAERHVYANVIEDDARDAAQAARSAARAAYAVDGSLEYAAAAARAALAAVEFGALAKGTGASNHTPTPWRVVADTHELRIEGASGATLALLLYQHGADDSEEARANAELIVRLVNRAEQESEG